MLATTGMGPIQAQRLHVESLIMGEKARLMVSKRAKGGDRNRSRKEAAEVSGSDHGLAGEQIEAGSQGSRRP
jgi:hypothetical protein